MLPAPPLLTEVVDDEDPGPSAADHAFDSVQGALDDDPAGLGPALCTASAGGRSAWLQRARNRRDARRRLRRRRLQPAGAGLRPGWRQRHHGSAAQPSAGGRQAPTACPAVRTPGRCGHRHRGRAHGPSRPPGPVAGGGIIGSSPSARRPRLSATLRMATTQHQVTVDCGTTERNARAACRPPQSNHARPAPTPGKPPAAGSGRRRAAAVAASHRRRRRAEQAAVPLAAGGAAACAMAGGTARARRQPDPERTVPATGPRHEKLRRVPTCGDYHSRPYRPFQQRRPMSLPLPSSPARRSAGPRLRVAASRSSSSWSCWSSSACWRR